MYQSKLSNDGKNKILFEFVFPKLKINVSKFQWEKNIILIHMASHSTKRRKGDFTIYVCLVLCILQHKLDSGVICHSHSTFGKI